MRQRDVLRAFRDATRSGDGWIAHCPAHEDRCASLSIGLGDDGRWLLKCHAGCHLDTVLHAAHLDMRDLFPKSIARVGAAAEAVYDYRDEAGAVLFQVVRRAGKSFTHRRPNKNGGYTYNVKGVRRLLYRLPELLRCESVTVAEGEKDVDRLWSLGIPATTNAGGAGKWQSEHTSQLVAAGVARLVVLADNDDAGRAHAETIARSWYGVGREVRIIDLPALPPKGDISDWLDAGHTADELRAAVEAAPLWTPGTLADSATDEARGVPMVLQSNATATAIDELLAGCGLSGFSAPIDMGAVEVSLRLLAHQLTGADKLRRIATREALIVRLKAAGVQSPAKLVDAALFIDADDASARSGFSLADDEPSPEPVDGAGLLDTIADRLAQHLVLPAYAVSAIALWILHTYVMDAWQLSPLLTFMSPTKRCGKSTALMLVASLCPKQLLASSVTAASLFRIVDHCRPTLSIDEADKLLHDNDELRAIINAGYLKKTAAVLRCCGDQHLPVPFSSWAAKMIAMIGTPPDTIADRSILVRMQRKAPGDRVARLRADRLETDALPLRRQATRWARDHAGALADSDPGIPDSLNDRAADNWRPLLATADTVGGHWPDTARRAARALTGDLEATDAEPASVLLLTDVRQWFYEQGAGCKFAPSTTLLAYLADLEARPWPEWRGGKPISGAALASMLKSYNVRPQTVRIGPKTPNGYRRDDFTDAWARYLPPIESEQSEQCNKDGPNRSLSTQNTVRQCSESATEIASANPGVVPAVPGQLAVADDEELRI